MPMWLSSHQYKAQKSQGSPIKDIKLPSGMTIGGLVRGDEGMLVSGNTQVEAGDTVVVFCYNVDKKKAERLFN